MSLNASARTVPPNDPTVSVPSRNPAGWDSVTVYVPGRKSTKAQSPFTSVAVTRFTGFPRSSVPVNVIVTPSTPTSVASKMPSLFASSNTDPLKDVLSISPKS